jgi:hypothetical protein
MYFGNRTYSVARFVIGNAQFSKSLPEIATENPETRKKNWYE